MQRMEQGMVSREVKSGGRRVARRHEIHLLSLSALQNLGGILSLLVEGVACVHRGVSFPVTVLAILPLVR